MEDPSPIALSHLSAQQKDRYGVPWQTEKSQRFCDPTIVQNWPVGQSQEVAQVVPGTSMPVQYVLPESTSGIQRTQGSGQLKMLGLQG